MHPEIMKVVEDIVANEFSKHPQEISKNIDSIISEIVKHIRSEAHLYDAFRHAQFIIAEKTGVNDLVRSTLLRKFKGDHALIDLVRREFPKAEDEKIIEEEERRKDAYYIVDSVHSGKVIDVIIKEDTISRITQGVKKNNSQEYNNSPHYFGGNGTYRFGFPEKVLQVNLLLKVKHHPHIWIDVRSRILRANNCKKVTSSLVEELKSLIVGKEMTFRKLPEGADQCFDILTDDVLKV